MALRQAETGTTAAEICRKLQITEATFYRCKKKFGGPGVPELGNSASSGRRNGRRERLVADLSVDKEILQEALRRNGEPGAAEGRGDVGAAGLPALPASGDPGALRVPRSSVRYQSIKAPREPLRVRVREIAAARVSYGHRQVHTLLRREGWPVNHKLVYRLCREEGLTLRRKRPRRRRRAARREQRQATARPSERWAMDFTVRRAPPIGGQTVWVLAVIDVHARECTALQSGCGFRSEQVAGILADAGAKQEALPDLISVDNGTEFTSKALDHWAYWNRVKLDFSRPGKPTDNAHIEAFNSVLRRECLSQHWVIDLEDAQRVLDRWRTDYSNFRPHGSFARSTPADFAAGALFARGSEKLENSRL